MMKGLVIRTTGSWYRVLSAGICYDCRLRGHYRLNNSKQTNPIAVGDYVFFALNTDGTGTISEVDERRNCIIRRATKLSKQTQVIAANIDLLCVVATIITPRTSTGFIDRLLVTAEAYHIPACIILNKVDLYGDTTSSLWHQHRELKACYEQVGYPVYETSAATLSGIDTLRTLIDNKVVLFSGHSGVGKSALLNAIDPNLQLKVGEVSDWSLKGRHTTTFAEIFPFDKGYLIDTPGIKEFGMVDFTRQELSHFFPEMRPLIPHCHFSNCTHLHEPGCAVRTAAEEGQIPESRYINYLNILETLER